MKKSIFLSKIQNGMSVMTDDKGKTTVMTTLENKNGTQTIFTTNGDIITILKDRSKKK
jgi:hypothetical protein